MEAKELTAAVTAIARDHGFRSKGRVFYKVGTDLRPYIELQRSKWGRALYVNVGLSMVAEAKLTDWAWLARADDVPGPHRDCFFEFSRDGDGLIDPRTLMAPLEWLFDWVNDNLLDEARIKDDVRRSSGICSVAPPSAKLKAWAAA
jgi:hypothetical protein